MRGATLGVQTFEFVCLFVCLFSKILDYAREINFYVLFVRVYANFANFDTRKSFTPKVWSWKNSKIIYFFFVLKFEQIRCSARSFQWNVYHFA